MAHPLAGRSQTPEHVARRMAGIAKAKTQWTPERAALYRVRVGAANKKRSPEAQARFAQANVGRTPWNKGNDWRVGMTIEEIRALTNLRARLRRATNPGRRLHDRMSALVRQTLRGGKTGRSWTSLVGYSREALMQRLASQFKPGMTWENMGEWHIDHIIPRSAFTFTHEIDAEFQACWALSNLQPLWAEENMAKRTQDRLVTLTALVTRA